MTLKQLIIFSCYVLGISFVKATLPDPESCYNEGECEFGTLVGHTTENDVESCHASCQVNELCFFFTFYSSSGECRQYYDCDNFAPQTCSECSTGMKNCTLSICFKQGFCIGRLSQTDYLENADDCLDLCKSDANCEWFSFDQANRGYCALTVDCPVLDPACLNEDCVHGQRDCLHEGTTTLTTATYTTTKTSSMSTSRKTSTSTRTTTEVINPSRYYQRLMVVGGTQSENQVEAIDLSGNNQHCRNLQNVPIDWGGIGTFINGEAIVCNGFRNGFLEGRCFTYDDSTDSWMEGASTSHEVYWSAGVKINNERNWWISGGYFASGSISDSVIYDGASFGSFESLPNTADYRHHMIGVNDTHVVYLEGSYFGVRNAGLFDLTTNSWNSFTHLPDDKEDYFAGVAIYPDGSRHVLAAGGDYFYDTQTWIFDLDSGIDLWRPGPPLGLQMGASVQFNDTVLAVGGELNDGSNDYTNQIWEFNPDPLDEKWILRQEGLKSAKRDVSAFLLPNNYATC